MVFSYYQLLDPFSHSFHYVHITQGEGGETMTAARHVFKSSIKFMLLSCSKPSQAHTDQRHAFYNCILQPVLLSAI